jgi:DNA-binding transcriptional MocR family regulator
MLVGPQWRALAPSLTQALAAGVRNAVLDGRIRASERLPPERQLAELRHDTSWAFTPPPGGLWLWLRLRAMSGDELAARAAAAGLALLPGSRFSPDGTLSNWLRVPFTAPRETLGKAVALLRQAYHSR